MKIKKTYLVLTGLNSIKRVKLNHKTSQCVLCKKRECNEKETWNIDISLNIEIRSVISKNNGTDKGTNMTSNVNVSKDLYKPCL